MNISQVPMASSAARRVWGGDEHLLDSQPSQPWDGWTDGRRSSSPALEDSEGRKAMLARTQVDAGDGGLEPIAGRVQGVSAWAGTRAAGSGGGRGCPSFPHHSQLRRAASARPFLAHPALGAHSSHRPVALQFWFVSLPAGWEGWGGQGRSGR